MRILGVSNAWDAGAALVVDGRIVAAVNEERFSRVKLDRCFPERSIDFVLEAAGLGVHDIDLVASGCWKGVDAIETAPRLAEDVADQVARSADPALTGRIVADRLRVSERRDREFRDEFMERVARRGIGEDRIRFYDHHYTHAVSAWSPSGFNDALVLTADGRGDGRSVTLWRATKQGLTLLDMATELVSPGALYGFITGYMGFVPDRHEGKVTGLAAYGERSEAYDLLSNGFGFDRVAGRLTSSIGRSYSPFALADMTDLRLDLDGCQREDVAHAVQAILEESLVGFLVYNIERLGIDSTNLCLAGGVALNCVGNGRILREGPFEDIWIQPAAGDAGGALGVALLIWHQLLDKPRVPRPGDSQSDSLLGPRFSEGEVRQFLDQVGARYQYFDTDERLCEYVAEKIAQGKVVGWFQGRMEFGPRALGNRSILGDARSSNMQKNLNLKVKFRESFRPFAPSVLREDVSEWFQMNSDSPYMLLITNINQKKTVEMTKEQKKLFGIDKLNIKRSDIPAVTHVDYSARIQTVHKNTNLKYYNLIKKFKEITNCPVVVNTSFNIRGEPIVNTPENAFNCFMGTELDKLVIGNFILEKEKQDQNLKKDYSSKFELD